MLEFIGQGGMSFVYKVRQPGLDRVVALKILSPALGEDPSFEERFSREARILGKLQHPNIVTVFEYGEEGGFFYLLMEFVDGINLRQAMAAGRFSPEQALEVVPGICDALQAAHAQGICHSEGSLRYELGMALWFYGICLSSFLVLVNFIYIGLCLSRMKPLAVWLTLAACLLLYFGVRYANYCYIHMNY